MNNRDVQYGSEQDFSGADTVMANRLLALRRAPSPALEARVSGIPLSSHSTNRLAHRYVWAAVTVACVAILLAFTAQPLRAAMESLQMRIGDAVITVTDRSPDTGNATVVAPKLMTLQDARTSVAFEFLTPAVSPEGWTMDSQVRVYDLGSGPFVEIVWTNPGRGDIVYTARSVAQADSLPTSFLVGTSEVREVQLGGQPVALVKGGWDHESREWAWPEMTTLVWTRDGTMYTLLTSDRAVREAELLMMAEPAR